LARAASTVQYSTWTNAALARSRSTTSRSATLCTRPAENGLAAAQRSASSRGGAMATHSHCQVFWIAS
jgi:hypothetical protein